jgi:hypothetical protein
LSPLVARENPFVSIDSADTIGKATSIQNTRVDFVEQSIKLPSSARVLKSMELHYQNLDGSIESKIVQIDKDIDWHDELVLKKAYTTPSIKIEQQETKMKEPIVLKEEIKESINFLDTLHIDIIENNIWIKTKDKKIRDFLVTNPYKIVMDFAKDISFTTKNYPLDIKPFYKVSIGNHDKYYRVVIELDGQYRYDISPSEEGFSIRVK